MRHKKISFDDVMKAELLSGEELLWAGQGDQNKLLAKVDIFLIPFSVIWCSFVVMWTIMAIAAEGFFWLAGLPMLVAGAFLTIGRFYVKTEQKKLTYYAITNRRVLILQVRRDGSRKHLTSLELSKITQESSKLDGNGRGTIIFGRVPAMQRFYFNSGFPRGHREQPVFLDVEHCRQVLRIYQTAKGKLKGDVGIPGFK